MGKGDTATRRETMPKGAASESALRCRHQRWSGFASEGEAGSGGTRGKHAGAARLDSSGGTLPPQRRRSIAEASPAEALPNDKAPEEHRGIADERLVL